MHFLFLFAHSFFIPFYMRAIINYTLDGLFMKYELMSIYVKKKKKTNENLGRSLLFQPIAGFIH